MTNRQDYIDKIDKIPTVSFNREQKAIAKKILEQVDEDNLDSVYGLITQRVKTGFVFDEAPEINHNCVALVKENKKLSIVGDGLESVEHKLIIGENYDALKNLCATYIDKNGKGLIDVIYIDPPYNTEATKKEGNDYKEELDATKFVYRDKFTRDGWLNMMNERLKLAQRLLADTGVIFISIDDSEQAYLKVLCDEIFGENNCIGVLPRLTKKGGKSSDNVQKNNDYILVYFKTDKASLRALEHTDSAFRFSDEYEQERGKFKLNQTLDYDTLGYVHSLDYPIKIEDEIYYPGNVSKAEYLNRKAENPKDGFRWRWSEDLFKFGYKNGFISVNKKTHRIYTKTYQNASIEEDENGNYIVEIQPRKKTLTSIDLIDNQFSNDNAKKELKKILGKFQFEYPKPSALIRELIRRIKNENAVVLDFFAGTGTTGQAVMELNAEDGGKRKFILVTNNENNIGEKITRERLYRVIKGEGSEKEKIDWKYTQERPFLSSNNVTTFTIEYTDLSLNDLEKAKKIKEQAKIEFRKLNENCIAMSDIDVYNELSALNPFKGQK